MDNIETKTFNTEDESRAKIGPLLYTCPICKSEFYEKTEAENCINMHNKVDGNLIMHLIKFKMGEKFPRGIWVTNEENDAEFYVSSKELRARFDRLFTNYVK